MRARLPLSFLALTLTLTQSAPSEANNVLDGLGPREVALGGAKRAESVGALSTILNPSGLALNTQFVIEGYYGYDNENKGNLATVSFCDSTTPVAGCFFYRYLNADPNFMGTEVTRRYHEGGFNWARALSPQFLIGQTTRFFDYNSQVVGEKDVRGYAMDVGATLRPSSVAAIALVGYNLIGTDTPQYQRSLAGGLNIRPGGAAGRFALSADAMWNLEAEDSSKGRYGAGAELFLGGAEGQAAYPLRGGGTYDAASESSFVTFGVGYAMNRFGFDVGGHKQVSGTGDEFLIQMGIRMVMPTQIQ